MNVEMTYYISLIAAQPASAVFVLIDTNGRVLDRAETNLTNKLPLTLEAASATGSPHPRLRVLTFNGITELIEHRTMEPVFYISDDPM